MAQCWELKIFALFTSVLSNALEIMGIPALDVDSITKEMQKRGRLPSNTSSNT